MIRLVVALVFILASVFMAPMAGTVEAASYGNAAMTAYTPSFMADGEQVRCMDRSACMLTCAVCLPASVREVCTDVLTGSQGEIGTDKVLAFDLSWLVYRPP